VYRNQGHHKGTTSYLLDVQSNYLEGLNTRVVIPLRRPDTFPKAPLPMDLVPVFVIEGTECFLDTPRLAAIPLTELKNEMTSLAIYQSEISTALDRLRRRNAAWTYHHRTQAQYPAHSRHRPERQDQPGFVDAGRRHEAAQGLSE
jgi:toxin CcdB